MSELAVAVGGGPVLTLPSHNPAAVPPVRRTSQDAQFPRRYPCTGLSSTMFISHDRRLARLSAIFMGAFALGLAGCEEPAEIRVQTVPKQAIEPAEFAGLSDQEHAILAAIVPRGSEAWVFRLIGPREDVEGVRDAFEGFVGSLSFGEGRTRPEWTLPSGWREETAQASAMREATIRVPAGNGSELDLSVSRLPMNEDWLHYRLRNFNRWRRQLQLPVAGATEMDKSSIEVKLEKSPEIVASVISIAGKLSQDEGTTMGGGMSSAGRSPQPQGSAGRPAAGLNYETPEGWEPGPATSMRRASFVVREGGLQASVAVTAFGIDSGPQITNPLANVNRWRGQVGLGPVSAEELSETAESVEIGGEEGLYVALDGSGGTAADLAMRAAMVEHGDLVWFFKLEGPPEIVQRETEHFRQFIRSVEFE